MNETVGREEKGWEYKIMKGGKQSERERKGNGERRRGIIGGLRREKKRRRSRKKQKNENKKSKMKQKRKNENKKRRRNRNKQKNENKERSVKGSIREERGGGPETSRKTRIRRVRESRRERKRRRGAAE